MHLSGNLMHRSRSYFIMQLIKVFGAVVSEDAQFKIAVCEVLFCIV